MKAGIHPEYVEATVECACGAKFVTHATVPSIKVEICKECHPFFTGNQKLIDTAGRVDKFRVKQEKAKAAKSKTKQAKAPKAKLEQDIEQIEEKLEDATVPAENQ